MNKKHKKSPFLPEEKPIFLDTSSDDVTEDQILDYLAQIIVDIYNSEAKENSSPDPSTRG